MSTLHDTEPRARKRSIQKRFVSQPSDEVYNNVLPLASLLSDAFSWC